MMCFSATEAVVDLELVKSDKSSQEVRISFTERGVEIYFDGYGSKTEADGSVIFIEHYEGDLRVCVWSDVNEEDPMIISLDKARNELYKE